MKPHISLILIPVLLATASAKEGYHAYVETDATTDAYISSTTPYSELSAERYCEEDREWVPASLDAGDKAYCFTNNTLTHNFDFAATAFFNTGNSYVQLFGHGLKATKGSIVMDGIQLSAADLVTQSDGAVDTDFGLPQIAINNVLFAHGDYSVLESNYSTVNNWRADGYTIKLTKSGGTFTSGSVTGNVVIESAGAVKFDGLSIGGSLTVKSSGTVFLSSKSGLSQLGQGTLKFESGQQITLGEDPGTGENIHVIQGNVVVDYTGVGGGAETWDVDVKSKMEGSFTVTASSGRVNVGILSGAGNLAAKQIYLTSFSGSSLSLAAGESVMLRGAADATDSVEVDGGQQAEISFEGNLHAGKVISLKGKTITGTNDESLLSADSLVASAVGDISLAGGIQISGGKKSTISSTEGRVIFQGATDKTNLANTAIHASTVTMNGMTADNVQITGATGFSTAAVSYSDKLVLNQSAIKGDVKGTKDSCIIQVMESRIDGVVISAAELTLDTGIIEGAKSVSTLASKGASQISGQETVTVDSLSLGGGTLTVGTLESHDNDLVMQNLTVDAGTILNANMVLKNGATLEFAENAVVTLGCTVTLLGNATFTTGVAVVESPAVPGVVIMDSVEDVLDANRQSITLSWDKDTSLPRWHKELYKVGDKTYTTDASASGATLTNLSLVYERTYSDNGPYNGRLFIAALPEPATGTLSLLALAALATRRRRK